MTSRASSRDPLITGIGLISCLGVGETAHLAALDGFTPVVDETSFAPYVVHPMTALELAWHIASAENFFMDAVAAGEAASSSARSVERSRARRRTCASSAA